MAAGAARLEAHIHERPVLDVGPHRGGHQARIVLHIVLGQTRKVAVGRVAREAEGVAAGVWNPLDLGGDHVRQLGVVHVVTHEAGVIEGSVRRMRPVGMVLTLLHAAGRGEELLGADVDQAVAVLVVKAPVVVGVLRYAEVIAQVLPGAVQNRPAAGAGSAGIQ